MRALPRLLALFAVALAALAAGCQESGFDERKETARPLKVQHFRGESKVPGQADAPATLSLDATDDTLALGLKPVLATAPGGELPPYLRRRAGDLRVVPPVRAGDLVPVESADAEVIIDDESGGVALYKQLITIAPTVITAGGGAQWKLNLRLAGEALGRTNDAEALMNRYDRRVEEVRRAVGRGRKVALVRGQGRGRTALQAGAATSGRPPLRVVKPSAFARTVLADAGVKPVRKISEADALLYAGPDAQSKPGSSERISLPIVGRFAGRRERAVAIDADAWHAPGGLLAARAVLDDLQLALAR